MTADYPRTLEYEPVLAALKAAVAEKGVDFIYKPPLPGKCCYVHDEDGKPVPGCLIGNALHRLGVPLDVLLTCNEVAVPIMLFELEIYADKTTQTLMVFAQDTQDDLRPWGEALSRGIREAESIEPAE